MQHEIEIKYKKFFPVFMIVGSLFILGTSFIVGFSFNTITGIILLAVGVLAFNKPLVVITPYEIQMKNLLGMVVKKHPFTPMEIQSKEKGIYINEKKVVASWWADIHQDSLDSFINNLRKTA